MYFEFLGADSVFLHNNPDCYVVAVSLQAGIPLHLRQIRAGEEHTVDHGAVVHSATLGGRFPGKAGVAEGDQSNQVDSHILDMLLGHHTGQEAQDQLPVGMDLEVGIVDMAGTALAGVPAPVLPRKDKLFQQFSPNRNHGETNNLQRFCECERCRAPPGEGLTGETGETGETGLYDSEPP